MMEDNNQIPNHCCNSISRKLASKYFQDLQRDRYIYQFILLVVIYLMGCFGSSPPADRVDQLTKKNKKNREDNYEVKQEKSHFNRKQRQEKQFPYELEKHTLMNDYLRLVKKEQFSKTLHMTIGALLFDIDEYKYDAIGTAFMVSRNLIVTAAHNICHRKFQPIRLSKNLRFFAAATGEVNIKEDFYQIQQGQWRFPSQFESIDLDLILQFDYALVKLVDKMQKPIAIKQFNPLFIQCQQCPVDLALDYSQLKIYGYPSYEDNFKPMQEWTIKLNQYGDSKQKYVTQAKASERKIKYMMSTLTGQSGAPVVSQRGVVGVHLGSGKASENFNIGRLNTLQMIQNLQIWAEQLNGQPFQINRQRFCDHLKEKKSIKTKKESEIDLSFKGLQFIDIGTNLELKILNLNGNKLKKIDLSKNTKLTELSLSDNQFQQIDLANNTKLLELWLGHNQLTKINLIKNTELTLLSLQYNQIQQIDLSKNDKLNELWLYNNKIKQISLSRNTSLTLLRLYNNQLTKIDLSQNAKLQQLRLYNNKLTQINFPSSSELKELWLYSNKLAKIDLSNATSLHLLRLDGNILTEIDLSNNPLLQRLDLENNNLKIVTLWFNPQMHWGYNEGISLNDQHSKKCQVTFCYKKGHKQLLKYFIDEGTKGFAEGKKEHFVDKYKCEYKLQMIEQN